MTSLEVSLEQMVDSYGADGVVRALATVCHEKCLHVAQNWQDVPLAKRWARASETLGALKLGV